MTPKQKIAAGLLGGGLVLTAGVVYAMTRKRNGIPTITPEVHDAITNPTKTLAPSPSMSPADAAKALVSIVGVAKAIGIGASTTALTAGATAGEAATAAANAEAAATTTLTSGGTVTEAANAGAEAGGIGVGGSALLGVAAAVAAIGIVIGWAISLGVFSEKDWEPPYGQVPIKLNDYGASVAGLPSGSVVWLQPSFVQKMAADGKEAGEQRLYAFLEAGRKATEDKKAAMAEIQKINETKLDYTSAADWFRHDAYDPSTDWGAEVKAYLEPNGVYTPNWIKSTVDNHIAANTGQYQTYVTKFNATKYTVEHAQEIKQAIAAKNTGNSGTQFNGLGSILKPIALGSAFGGTGHARMFR